MKENSCKKISEELDVTVQDCQRIWQNLRNKYEREKKVMPSGSAAPVTPQWEYLKSMSFLNPYIKPRNTHTTTPIVAEKSQHTVTTLQQCTLPSQAPIFIDTSSGCSSTWANSTMIQSPLESPAQDYLLRSPQSNTENEELESREESMYEENIIIQVEDTEEQRLTANSERVQLAKGKSRNKKNTTVPDTSNEVFNAAKSITQHLKDISQKKKEMKTSADALGAYIASILKEMTPEQQKMKRRRLLEVLEDDD